MKIENIATSHLVPYARNSRTHGAAQIDQIAASIREFGFTNPVLIDGRNGIIAGHGRVLAAQKLGLSEIPCVRLSHLTEAQKRAYVIADNKIALNSGWDEEMLREEIQSLRSEDFDLSLAGLLEDDITSLFPDEAPPPDTSPQVIPTQYIIAIECRSEEQQVELVERFQQEGLKCRTLIS